MTDNSNQISRNKDLLRIFNVAKANKTKIFLIVVIVLVFGVAGYYLYLNYVKPRLNPAYVTNKEFIPSKEEEEKKQVDLILFYTSWCPHSKNALELWKALKPKYHERLKKQYYVYMKEVDCDEEEDRANEYNIDSYPTIKLVKSSDEIIEYDAKLEETTLEEFLEATL